MSSLLVPEAESGSFWLRVKALCRLRANDADTVEGRSKERYRNAFLTTASSVLAKVISVSTSLISVPLTLHYLGVERYGLWITISSIIAFLGFSDLGINNGLLNGISKAHGRNDRILARQYVSSAIFFLTGVASLFGLAFAVAYRWIPWGIILHVKSPEALAEVGPGAAAFFFCFFLTIPITVVTRIQSGYQQGFAANLWTSAGSLLALVALLIVIKVHGSLMLLVLALAGTPLIATTTNGLVLFGFQRPWLRPAWSQVTRSATKELFHSGFLFFFLQVAMAVGYSSDNIVLAQVLGPEAVTQYSVPAKLFGLINVMGAMIVAPLWPAYTEALVKRDNHWVRKTLKRSVILLVSCAAGLSAFLLLFGHRIIELWVGPKVHPSVTLLTALSLWSIIMACSTPLAMLLNAANVVKFQVIAASSAALLNIALSVFLAHRVGISGVVWGSIISQLIILVPFSIYVFRFLNRLEELP